MPGFSKPLIGSEPRHIPNKAKVLRKREEFKNIHKKNVISFLKDIVDSEKEVYVITIGAMTKLTVFLLSYPEMRNKVKVISMAGSVYYSRE